MNKIEQAYHLVNQAYVFNKENYPHCPKKGTDEYKAFVLTHSMYHFQKEIPLLRSLMTDHNDRPEDIDKYQIALAKTLVNFLKVLEVLEYSALNAEEFSKYSVSHTTKYMAVEELMTLLAETLESYDHTGELCFEDLTESVPYIFASFVQNFTGVNSSWTLNDALTLVPRVMKSKPAA